MVRIHEDYSDANVVLLVQNYVVRDVVVELDDVVRDSRELKTEKSSRFRRTVDLSVLEVVGDSAIVV